MNDKPINLGGCELVHKQGDIDEQDYDLEIDALMTACREMKNSGSIKEIADAFPMAEEAMANIKAMLLRDRAH